ncbi:GIY-YIG nuclease family protein [Flavobacteriaceae bacterium R38]|nr:GIY-YIG nuclease family protein [Flavobacteriaceae bacterium R38]
MQKSYVYIITNKNNSVLYTGVTSNLIKRIHDHKIKKYNGFAAKYNCTKLVYFEEFTSINNAISREKQIKAGSREKKEQLIKSTNVNWEDLSDDWIFYFD